MAFNWYTRRFSGRLSSLVVCLVTEGQEPPNNGEKKKRNKEKGGRGGQPQSAEAQGTQGQKQLISTEKGGAKKTYKKKQGGGATTTVQGPGYLGPERTEGRTQGGPKNKGGRADKNAPGAHAAQRGPKEVRNDNGNRAADPNAPGRPACPTRPRPTAHQPPSGWTSARAAADRALAGYGTAGVWMDVCAPGSGPSPCWLRNRSRPDGRVHARHRTQPQPATEQPPCRWTSAQQAATPGRAITQPQTHTNTRTQHNTSSDHTSKQEPSGPGHRTRKKTNPASTPVNRSHRAKDTARTGQRFDRAHWCTGAKWPRTPRTQHNAPTAHTGEQKPSGPEQRTRNTTHRAGTPENRGQVPKDTAHAAQHTERAHR